MTSTLVTILFKLLALQGQPLCAPEPVVTFLPINPQVCTPTGDHACQQQAEGGKVVVTLYRAAVDVGNDRSIYEVQIRERAYGSALTYVNERVYRDSVLVRSAPPLKSLDGERLTRVRPSWCNLPSVTLTDP